MTFQRIKLDFYLIELSNIIFREMIIGIGLTVALTALIYLIEIKRQNEAREEISQQFLPFNCFILRSGTPKNVFDFSPTATLCC